MEQRAAGRPRAVGRRIAFAQLPIAVRDWVADTFGRHTVVAEHVGGMSPGCATTLATAHGGLIFVKAVGSELNAQTCELFRQESRTLARLAAVPYRPNLLGTYDGGGWTAIALEHVAGRFPDLDSEADFAAVAQTVETQIAELTPAPDGVDVPSLAATAGRWLSRWADVLQDPETFLPLWALDRVDDLFRRVTDLPERLPDAALCHFDVRDDNLLIRPDGRAVIVDWGMARQGPAWTDQVLLAVQRSSPREAQGWLEQWIRDDAQQTVTDLIVAVAGSQAWNAQQPAKPSLPSFAAFARDDSIRLFELARLRLP